MGKLLEKYKGLAKPELLTQVRNLALRFEGSSLLHVYSGRLPAGVKEMLDRIHDLFADIGVHHQSTMLTGTEEFFDQVRSAEDSFSKKPKPESFKSQMDVYLETMKENSRRTYLSANLIVVHGIQPMGLVEHRPDRHPWVWRSHSDFSGSLPGYKAFASKYERMYQGMLFPHVGFAPETAVPVFIVPPSVNPFGASNEPMSPKELQNVLEKLHVPSDRPLVLQFLAQGTASEIQEAAQMWKGVRGSHRASLVLVHIGLGRPDLEGLDGTNGQALHGQSGVHVVCFERGGSREMAALGWAATVAVDRSLTSWPNLHVLDLLWKGKPVLLAERSRTSVFIPERAYATFKSSAELAWHLGSMLQDRDKARRMGDAGRECIIERYLAPRHLLDYLKLLLYFEEHH